MWILRLLFLYTDYHAGSGHLLEFPFVSWDGGCGQPPLPASCVALKPVAAVHRTAIIPVRLEPIAINCPLPKRLADTCAPPVAFSPEITDHCSYGF